MTDTARDLERLVRQRAAANPWLERSLASTEDPGSITFRAVYAAVTRRLGAAAAESVPPR